ncbi:MAG: CPBP family intramembrane metalloprotease [Lachnospiraceae bacterium]|nr:CPBP family intramembrane metalloprotease [Lachnospiraceae bacterium]
MTIKTKLPALLPIRSVVFLLIFALGSKAAGRELSDISNWWTIVATVVNLFTILLLVFVSKKNGMTYLQLINYRKGATKAGQVILLSLIILIVGVGGMYLAGFLCYGVIPYTPPMMIAPIAKIPAVINFFLLPVTTALAEDGLYLGCGVNMIENQTMQVIIPAFFYALQHCFIPTLFDGKYILYRFLSFLPLTVILCLYYRKKRNPVPVMVGHALIDLMTVSWVLATSLIPGFYEMMYNMAK